MLACLYMLIRQYGRTRFIVMNTLFAYGCVTGYDMMSSDLALVCHSLSSEQAWRHQKLHYTTRVEN